MRRLLAAVLLFVAATAHGGTAVARLRDLLADSSDLLKAGKYEEALKIDDTVIREMGEYYVSGDATTQFFCIAVVHKALAYAGMGKEDDALWYWDTAISLYPAFLHSDMSMYGKAGEFLKRYPPSAEKTQVRAGAKMTPVEVIKQTEPKFPNRSLTASVEGPVEIEVVVGKDGKAHRPRIIDAMGAPIVAYQTVEAMRSWEFRPATADGQPIDSRWRLVMNYKILR